MHTFLKIHLRNPLTRLVLYRLPKTKERWKQDHDKV
nr:MAG TPA: hypothetical protein [Caudoviricetes sp.]